MSIIKQEVGYEVFKEVGKKRYSVRMSIDFQRGTVDITADRGCQFDFLDCRLETTKIVAALILEAATFAETELNKKEGCLSTEQINK